MINGLRLTNCRIPQTITNDLYGGIDEKLARNCAGTWNVVGGHAALGGSDSRKRPSNHYRQREREPAGGIYLPFWLALGNESGNESLRCGRHPRSGLRL